ncbi:S-adenosyl-L-methionine methyltransferase [Enhydrobacter aerosaccus]|uniref:S-adenosyl-L-methionine methyltransferase n=1 Tax=Enhydrobacter aerosaccus TaxID=225324 RepID=A0A1T4QPX5_9HYPH|nr:class I SAM-dependent methyltransferase [Enhydrobacter aerosaccus]SKA05308.1 S-adenosyl-L-methionine methyltransferase [Enhydrobacter aerosaccus]
MSRLDSFIARMKAQRDCLNFLQPEIDRLPGPIFEVGLGNGRTYDHLRTLFPGRDIYVFERQVAAHPDCIPPEDHLFLGEARESIPRAAARLGATAALIHTDLGTGDHAANVAMGEWLGPALDALAASGGYVLANQSLKVPRWERLPEPPGVPADRYFLYRVR